MDRQVPTAAPAHHIASQPSQPSTGYLSNRVYTGHAWGKADGEPPL